ncbi:stress responsive alpha-beta barrel domain-containing protein [Novosphingobium sp. PP1Y]|nr:stress responsive alpha-beta barrel domain-containing protein [Novosphingobium sp. PY1]CCA91393.1 stress responsive alpha-beta barrel domain-containing protein [Novosphingobium sp. PP1Y]
MERDVIRHVVMIKFKKDAPQEKIDVFLEEVKKLSHLNREVRDYSHGLCVKTRYHSGDFDFANCCDIDSYEAMDRYMSHWAHLRMTPFLPDILENMISFDWEIDYRGPDFDEKLAAEEAEREKARVLKLHDDADKAYVPEIRGQTRERAKEMLEMVGLSLASEEDEIIGSVWAPNRIMFQTPDPDTEVVRGSEVKIGITGNWLTGPATPEGDGPAW